MSYQVDKEARIKQLIDEIDSSKMLLEKTKNPHEAPDADFYETMDYKNFAIMICEESIQEYQAELDELLK